MSRCFDFSFIFSPRAKCRGHPRQQAKERGSGLGAYVSGKKKGKIEIARRTMYRGQIRGKS